MTILCTCNLYSTATILIYVCMCVCVCVCVYVCIIYSVPSDPSRVSEAQRLKHQKMKRYDSYKCQFIYPHPVCLAQSSSSVDAHRK